MGIWIERYGERYGYGDMKKKIRKIQYWLLIGPRFYGLKKLLPPLHSAFGFDLSYFT